jgi:hypothetical protein
VACLACPSICGAGSSESGGASAGNDAQTCTRRAQAGRGIEGQLAGDRRAACGGSKGSLRVGRGSKGRGSKGKGSKGRGSKGRGSKGKGSKGKGSKGNLRMGRASKGSLRMGRRIQAAHGKWEVGSAGLERAGLERAARWCLAVARVHDLAWI